MTSSTPDPGPERIVLADVRVFDGHRVTAPQTVVVEGSRIGTGTEGGTVVDGRGGVLVPGLIDAHVHLRGVADLESLAAHGVTTALDMACWPPELVDSLRHRTGLADVRSAGTSATSPGSRHSHMPHFPAGGLVSGPADAEGFVAARVAEGSDYIKLIADVPGPDQATLDAVVTAARDRGRLTVAHAATAAATAMALCAGVDVVTHVPLDEAVDDATATRMARAGRITVPTLTMMEAVAAAMGVGDTAARESVAALHRAGVPVLAGTDANSAPGAPAAVPHGSSLHHELELLVGAGLSTLDALRAATVLPARHFGLDDRSVIAPGHRADLVLLDADPLDDIRATRAVRRVWCAGVEPPCTA